MNYPGRVIAAGEADAAAVAAVVAALRRNGVAVREDATCFDTEVAAAVRAFQAAHRDSRGRPLAADGQVGPLTWAVLVRPAAAAPDLAAAALAVAAAQVGEREAPAGSNSGPMVDRYLRSVGCLPGAAWCMAFVSWCFQQAALSLGVPDLFPRTGGCLDGWNRVRRLAPGRIVSSAQAQADPARIRPGLVFVLDHGGGRGHAGFVRGATGLAFRTIEGNSNEAGGREGVGVFALNRRRVDARDLKGFLDFTGAAG